MAAAYVDNATATCYVDHRTMEVSWEPPTWNAGCWVGLSIGALLLCPVALVCAALPLGLMYHGAVRFEARRVAAARERYMDATARRLWEEECHTIDEQVGAAEALAATGAMVRVTFRDANGIEFDALLNDKWEVASMLTQLPLRATVGDYRDCRCINVGDRTMPLEACLRDFDVADGAVLHCSTVDQVLLEQMRDEDTSVVRIALPVPVKPTLEAVRHRVEETWCVDAPDGAKPQRQLGVVDAVVANAEGSWGTPNGTLVTLV